jgi:hypothetical protein
VDQAAAVDLVGAVVPVAMAAVVVAVAVTDFS